VKQNKKKFKRKMVSVRDSYSSCWDAPRRGCCMAELEPERHRWRHNSCYTSVVSLL